mmetsp:Transcript_55404/g.130024  ORF Transcript_55404/g.130024 Transcript_55404/m.130024 type:complete len:119 (-) Transcript_55404:568-924(-)
MRQGLDSKQPPNLKSYARDRKEVKGKVPALLLEGLRKGPAIFAAGANSTASWRRPALTAPGFCPSLLRVGAVGFGMIQLQNAAVNGSTTTKSRKIAKRIEVPHVPNMEFQESMPKSPQ